MSSKPSPKGFLSTLVSAVRYTIKYIEKVIRFGWSQTSWTVDRARTYVTWVRTLRYLAVRVLLLFATPFIFVPLWTILVLWGTIRSL